MRPTAAESLSATLIACLGCGAPPPASATPPIPPKTQSSTIETHPLGFTASLSQEDAIGLVRAGRDIDAIRRILSRRVPQQWLRVLVSIVLGNNERFRKEVEAKNGPPGMNIEVWGLSVPMGFEADPVGDWIQSRIEKTILPESWHKNREIRLASARHRQRLGRLRGDHQSLARPCPRWRSRGASDAFLARPSAQALVRSEAIDPGIPLARSGILRLSW